MRLYGASNIQTHIQLQARTQRNPAGNARDSLVARPRRISARKLVTSRRAPEALGPK